MNVLCFSYTPLCLMRPNTDRAYLANLARLSDHIPLNIQFPKMPLSDAVETARDLNRILRHRLRRAPGAGTAFLTPLQERMLRALRPRAPWDVFYSNSRVPRGPGLGPVVRFDYIHEPAETEEPEAFSRDVAAKRASAAQCDLLQVSTEAQRCAFERIGVPADKLRVVPFYLPDLAAAPEPAVRARQQAAGPLRIAFVGHQARRKGLPELLAALRDPALVDLPLTLTIVSRFLDGDVALPEDPRVLRHVTLPHADVLRLMADSHVLAVPSRRETFGLVYLEGMAAGCVCVMAAGPQQIEISDGGRAGLPVGPDPAALARALHRLACESGYRTALAMAGRARFRQVYAPDRVAAAHAEMFRSVQDRSLVSIVEKSRI